MTSDNHHYPRRPVNPPARFISNEKLLTLPDIANHLQVSVTTVRRLIDEGKLKRIKVRGALRVRQPDYDAYLNELAA